MSEKTIGILGGMGPEATALLFQRIIELTPAKTDQEHLSIIIVNNPKIPNRSAAILSEGENPFPLMREGLAILERAGADFIIIPCNTAFYYFDQLQSVSKLPIIHLIEEVARATTEIKPRIQRVGLLATTGTVKTNLYQNILAKYGIKVILPQEWEQSDVMGLIHRIKGGDKDIEAVKAFIKSLTERGAQGLILGCTEFSLIASQLDAKIPIIDSIEVLAQTTVDIARGNQEINVAS